jgi:hypothetical protein
LAGLAGVFIYGKQQQKRELDEKAQGFIPPPAAEAKPGQLTKV